MDALRKRQRQRQPLLLSFPRLLTCPILPCTRSPTDNGEAVTVSGGAPLNLKASDWKKDPRMKGRWVTSVR